MVENASVDPATHADPCSTPISGTASANVSTRYVYDGLGNMTAMYDGRGNVTRYAFDALGHLLTAADPADQNGAPGLATSYAYDVLGQRAIQYARGNPALTLVTWA